MFLIVALPSAMTLAFATTDVQSACSNPASIKYLAVFKNIDILAIAETRLAPSDPVSSIFLN